MKILIFKLGFIGDVIMSLPALVALRQQHPEAHIIWVVDKPALPILQATGLVDELIVLEEKTVVSGSVWKRFRAVWQLWRKLGFRYCDLFINGHADPKVNILVFPVRVKRSKRFNRNGTAWQAIFPVPGRHHSHEFIKLFTDVSFPNTTPVIYPKLTLPELPSEIILPPQPFITLAPGGTQSTQKGGGWLRRWPIENYVALARQLIESGRTVALVGGKDDEWVLEYFGSLPVYNYIGRFSILETIRFLSYSQHLITNDCGPLHFAALANTPVLGLFGPTNPYEKVPLHVGASFLWGGEHLSCRPCYDNKVYADCKDNQCIKGLNLTDVIPKTLLQQAHEKTAN